MPMCGKVLFNRPMADLAEALAEITPGELQYSFFVNSGTESVEGCLKVARLATKRKKFVAAKNAFHGKTFGSLTATGRDMYREPFKPLLDGFTHVEYGDAADVDAAVDEDTAAVILEPVQGEGGIIVPPAGYLREVKEICEKKGALLIADEVQTGIGRTGSLFAFQQFGIQPDVVSFAKGIAGGLPLGMGGSALSLLSGGIDSPVSSYMMAKRGVSLEMVHFFSPPYTSDAAKEKVLELAQLLTPWCGRLTVHIVPFTEIQEQIRMNCPEDHFTLIMRRFMMRLAQRVADEVRAKALVTGECLGQVASQTMEALRVSEDVAELPVLRPLIGMDKEEIIRISRKIGTFDTSILPYEDCCTVFTPRHPKTKPHVEEVRELEAVLDVDALCDRAMAGREFVRIKF